jgi:hypothetical protein
MTLGISSFSLTKTIVEIAQQKTKELQKVLTKTVEIKGAIIDSTTQKPIQMAFVVVPGTNIGTITDPEGKFVIGIPDGAKQLSFSAKGYKSKKAGITINKDMEVKLVKKEK